MGQTSVHAEPSYVARSYHALSYHALSYHALSYHALRTIVRLPFAACPHYLHNFISLGTIFNILWYIAWKKHTYEVKLLHNYKRRFVQNYRRVSCCHAPITIVGFPFFPF